MTKCCRNEKKYIVIPPSSSDQPEALGACIFGTRSDEKDSSYIVNGTFKFKHPSMAEGFWVFGKIDLNTTNDFHLGWGDDNIAKIDVINFLLLFHFETFRFSDRIS